MKMKKVLAIVLIVALIASLAVIFAACGKDEKYDFTFGLITLHDESSTYDKNFIDAAKDVVEELKAEGIKVKLIVKSGIGETDACYDTAADLVDQGCNAIFADSFGHEPYMIQAAKEFTNVQFFHATGTNAHTEELANFHNAFASIYEGRYLAGVAAGMKLKELQTTGKAPATAPKIGYVGAFTYAEVMSGYTSFYLGVKSIVSDVVMDVTFTGSWYDETAEKEAANKLIKGGCVLISQHADSMGAPSACQKAGVPNVTYNMSTKASAPTTYVIGSKINWGVYYKLIIKAIMNNETIAYDWVGGIADGAVQLTELNTAVAAEGTAAKLEEVKTGLKNGTVKVFDTSTFTVGGQTLTQYLADVDDTKTEEGKSDFVHEKNVIENGIFAESKYRSAPYFDAEIDGITLLDRNYGD